MNKTNNSTKIKWGPDITLTQQVLLAFYELRKKNG